jgi:DNA-binding NarL/FixJ family response regulator
MSKPSDNVRTLESRLRRDKSSSRIARPADRPWRILLVDDHEIVRHGIRALLKSLGWCHVCGEAGTAREALESVKRLSPDLVLMDIALPDTNGLQVTREIVQAAEATNVLIFTLYYSDRMIAEAIAAGARGCLSKAQSCDELINALENLRDGRRNLHRKAGQDRGRGHLCKDDVLTPREREVVVQLAEGRSNKEAAAKLGISVKTVETHRARVMRKLELRSFAELVHYAIYNGDIRL